MGRGLMKKACTGAQELSDYVFYLVKKYPPTLLANPLFPDWHRFGQNPEYF
jgi:hypothetical protein